MAKGSPSNFAFLQADWPVLFREARQAERWTLLDLRTSCFYARRTLEHLVTWPFDADPTLRRPYKDDLKAMLHEPTFTKLVGHPVPAKADVIRKQGNNAVHGSHPISRQDTLAVLRELFHVTFWLGRRYARTEASRPPATFDSTLLPQPQAVPSAVQTRVQLKRLEEDLAARDLFIDLLLAGAGWALDAEQDREFPVAGMPNPSGKGNVDYVLWGDDGKPLAVVEAKKTTRDARSGRQQAKKKDELQLIVQRRGSRPPPAEARINPGIVEHHYQQRAIRRIAETFERDHQRWALVVMATGAGKAGRERIQAVPA